MSSRRRSPARRSKSVRRGGRTRRSAVWCCPRATTSQPPVHPVARWARGSRGTIACGPPPREDASHSAATARRSYSLMSDLTVLDRCTSGTGVRRYPRVVDRIRQAVGWALAVPVLWVSTVVYPALGRGYLLVRGGASPARRAAPHG